MKICETSPPAAERRPSPEVQGNLPGQLRQLESLSRKFEQRTTASAEQLLYQRAAVVAAETPAQAPEAGFLPETQQLLAEHERFSPLTGDFWSLLGQFSGQAPHVEAIAFKALPSRSRQAAQEPFRRLVAFSAHDCAED